MPLRTRESVVQVDSEIMHGVPCFAGTRVPVKSLIDHLIAGDSVGKFLDDFPSVKREQVVAFLELAGDVLGDGAYPAR